MNKVPTAYLIVGGLAVTGGTLMYMYNTDKNIQLGTGKPKMKYLTWLRWKWNGSPKLTVADFDMSEGMRDMDNLVSNLTFSVPNSSATTPRY